MFHEMDLLFHFNYNSALLRKLASFLSPQNHILFEKSFLLYANWKDVALAKPPSSQATKETSTMQSYISACSDFPNILFI